MTTNKQGRVGVFRGLPQDSSCCVTEQEDSNYPPLYAQAFIILMKRTEECHPSNPESMANCNEWPAINGISGIQTYILPVKGRVSGSLLGYLLLTNKSSGREHFPVPDPRVNSTTVLVH